MEARRRDRPTSKTGCEKKTPARIAHAETIYGTSTRSIGSPSNDDGSEKRRNDDWTGWVERETSPGAATIARGGQLPRRDTVYGTTPAEAEGGNCTKAFERPRRRPKRREMNLWTRSARGTQSGHTSGQDRRRPRRAAPRGWLLRRVLRARGSARAARAAHAARTTGIRSARRPHRPPRARGRRGQAGAAHAPSPHVAHAHHTTLAAHAGPRTKRPSATRRDPPRPNRADRLLGGRTRNAVETVASANGPKAHIAAFVEKAQTLATHSSLNVVPAMPMNESYVVQYYNLRAIRTDIRLTESTFSTPTRHGPCAGSRRGAPPTHAMPYVPPPHAAAGGLFLHKLENNQNHWDDFIIWLKRESRIAMTSSKTWRSDTPRPPRFQRRTFRTAPRYSVVQRRVRRRPSDPLRHPRRADPLDIP